MISGSIDREYHDQAIECLKVLRESCINEEEVSIFNNFLKKIKEKLILKKNFTDFWKML